MPSLTLFIPASSRVGADVFNNLDFDYLKRDPSVTIAFKAGMQAYHEYQGQLMADMPVRSRPLRHLTDFVCACACSY